MPPVTRRAFLKLTAVAASAVTFARLMPGRAVAAVRACIPFLGMEVPMLVPTVIGGNCDPPITPTLTASATQTATVTPSATVTASSTPTASASPTATPSATAAVVSMRTWFPMVLKHLPDG